MSRRRPARDDALTTIHRRNLSEIDVGAPLTKRPHRNGSFPIADFEILHTNLAAAFPTRDEIAAAGILEGESP